MSRQSRPFLLHCCTYIVRRRGAVLPTPGKCFLRYRQNYSAANEKIRLHTLCSVEANWIGVHKDSWHIVKARKVRVLIEFYTLFLNDFMWKTHFKKSPAPFSAIFFSKSVEISVADFSGATFAFCGRNFGIGEELEDSFTWFFPQLNT
jgi:hypothetical protein